ncbi:MAG TPA: RNB domain-containing ribonuclease [Opitutales bacterium]|jgi:ribonuclease R|nr:RNB domain-containing ribonuclease [Opitutales bacterium]
MTSSDYPGTPATLEDRLLELLRRKDYTPLRVEEIAAALQLDSRGARKLPPLVHHLLNTGLIAKVKQDRFVIPRDADLQSGSVKFRQSGAAIFFPDPPSGGVAEAPWHIFAEDTGTAMHGDRVLVRENKSSRPWRAGARGGHTDKIGRIIRVLERKHETISGTLRRDNNFWSVAPDDPRFVRTILVPDPAQSGVFPPPKPGDKVLVRLQEWTQRHLNPTGEIIENLGRTHTPGAEFKAILYKFHLKPEFPEAVQAEAAAIPPEVRPRDRAGREDARELYTITIDPDDAKDFDDALSLERLPGGEMRVGIHIADVSAYVRTNTALDREARERGNSTYLVGCVIPMLPHALSNGLCSLVEAQDRLVKSVYVTFGANGKIRATRFANSVIRSRKRLTYRQAFALLKENVFEKIRALPLPPAHATGSTGRALASLSDAELVELRDCVRAFWSLAEPLRRARMQKGSLDFDFPEVKIFTDADGLADRLELIENDESHQLVEEYMLLANEVVARALHEAGLPFLSRVHDQPDPEKLIELRESLATFGVMAGDLTQRKEVVEVLQKIRNHPQGHALKTQFLRSLKQACYRASVDGHYGLFKKFYTHFTSPIRRYSDLVVHRIFDNYLQRTGAAPAGGPPPVRYNQAELDALARHLSLTEQNSTEAERETVKLKLLEFFEREAQRTPRRSFPALITDIRNHGFFIELRESSAYGFVPLSSLEDDLYSLSGDGRELVGRRTKRKFTLGQEVPVEVFRVDRFKRQIDFRIVGSARKSGATDAGGDDITPAMAAHHKKMRDSRGPKPRPPREQNRNAPSSRQNPEASPGNRGPRDNSGQNRGPRHQPPSGRGNRGRR